MILMPKRQTKEDSNTVSTYTFGSDRQLELCYIIESAFDNITQNGVVVNASSRINSIKEFKGKLEEASYRLSVGFANAHIHISINPNLIKISSNSAILNDEIKQTIIETRCPDEYRHNRQSAS